MKTPLFSPLFFAEGKVLLYLNASYLYRRYFIIPISPASSSAKRTSRSSIAYRHDARSRNGKIDPRNIHSRRSSRLFLDIHRYSRINIRITVARSRGNARKALRKEEIRYREFGKPFVTAIDEQSAIYPIRIRSIRKKEERIINDQLIAVSGASNWRH